MYPFSPLENVRNRKLFDIFMGYGKGALGTNVLILSLRMLKYDKKYFKNLAVWIPQHIQSVNTATHSKCVYRNTFKVCLPQHIQSVNTATHSKYVLPFLNIMNEWVKVHQSKLLTSNFYIHKEYFDDVNLPICLQDVQGD